MNALIVEDNPLVRTGMAKALEASGFATSAAGDAVTAFHELTRSVFDVIVCDIGLPIVDGITFYRELVERHPSMSNRVLFVTGMTDDPVVDAFLKACGRPVLGKPFELQDLVTLVQEVAELNPRNTPVGTFLEDDRAMARQLPDEFLALSGQPHDRITTLLRRHWSTASEIARRDLGQMLMVLLDPLFRGGGVTEQLRGECEEAVLGWTERQ